MVNNARIAILERPDGSNIQGSCAQTFNTIIIGVALMMTTFLPLMKENSLDARIITLCSARASFNLSPIGNLPPSRIISYSVSKTGLSRFDGYAKAEPTIAFYAASPGHCKIALNGFGGTMDSLDGAKVNGELALAERKEYENVFWQMEGGGKEASRVPW